MTNKRIQTIIKQLCLLFFFMLFNAILIAQPNNLLSDCGNQVASDDCSGVLNQPTICELDGFISSTSMLTQDQATETLGFCGNTISHNNMWISFTPYSGDVLFEFIINSCEGTPFQFDGLQAVIMQIDCDSGMPATYFGDCQFCSTQTFQIGAQNLTPGGEYLMMLDGCNGDVCDFEIDVLEGLPPAGFEADIQTTQLCPNQEAFIVTTVTPSNGNYIYQWIGPDGEEIPDANEAFYNASEEGVYTVIVRDNTTCCPAEVATTVALADNPPQAVVDIQNHELNCNIEGVLLDASGTDTTGNVSFSWISPTGVSLSPQGLTTIVNEPGIYTFQMFDNVLFCVSEIEVEVIDNNPTAIIQSSDTFLTCNNSSVTLDASASTGENICYEWIDPNGLNSSDTIVNVELAGTYSLIVTNKENGCSSMSDFTIEEHFININEVNFTADCVGSDIVVDVDITGTHPPFIYTWTIDPTTQEVQLVATDSIGCTDIQIEILDVVGPEPIAANPTIQEDNGTGNGAIDLTVTGGTPPYIFIWDLNPGVATTEDITNLLAGEYDVQITDANGCTTVLIFTVELNTNIQNIDLINQFNLYPNPTNGSFVLDFNLTTSDKIKIEILDVIGRTIYISQKENIQKNKINLDLENQADGIYMVKIKLRDTWMVQKVVKQSE